MIALRCSLISSASDAFVKGSAVPMLTIIVCSASTLPALSVAKYAIVWIRSSACVLRLALTTTSALDPLTVCAVAPSML